MATKIARLYWDSSCLIALWESEPNIPSEQLQALRSTFADMVEGKVKIVTSDLYYTEVFQDPEDERAMRIKLELESCPNFEILQPATNISLLAGRLRKACDAVNQKLKSPDALHMAAGQLCRCDEVWTTDGNLVKKSGNGLLGTTPVVFPHVTQYRLELEP